MTTLTEVALDKKIKKGKKIRNLSVAGDKKMLGGKKGHRFLEKPVADMCRFVSVCLGTYMIFSYYQQLKG